MGRRGRHLVFVVAGLTAGLVAAAAAAGAGRSVRPVQVAAPTNAERVVAYGRSQLLLIQPGSPESSGSITRANLNGTVDRSFGDEGTIHIAAEDATVDPDGKILVATASDPSESAVSSQARVTRLLPDGRPDHTFGIAGHADVDFGGRYDYGEAVVLAANGDILVAGLRVNYEVNRGESSYSLAVARLKPDGSLDRPFGRNGVRIFPGGGEIEVFDIAPTPFGGIVMEGGNEIESFLWKLSRDGSIDRGFGNRGFLVLRGKREKPGYHEELLVVPGLAVLPSGKLLLAGSGSPNRGPNYWVRVVAVRLLPDGRVDPTYGDDGWAAARKGPGWTLAGGLTLLPGGVLTIATSFESPHSNEQRDFGAIAFGPDGHLERRFGTNGWCRAKLAGREEAVGDVTLGRRAVILGDGVPDQWLFECPLH
jgi:uncharacterized delta-60 repeat protein